VTIEMLLNQISDWRLTNILQMDEMKEQKRQAAEEKRKNAKPWW
jgi:hypothetical protein